MLLISGENQGLGERQPTALRGWLKGHVGILASTQTMREMDEPRVIQVTGHMVSGRVQLLGNRRMRDDHARDRGSVVGTYEYGTRVSPILTSIGGNTQETKAEWPVDVFAGI